MKNMIDMVLGVEHSFELIEYLSDGIVDMELYCESGEQVGTGGLSETGGGVQGMGGLLSLSMELMLSQLKFNI